MFKFKKKKESNESVSFEMLSFKDKIYYLLKSISEDDYEYQERLKLINKFTDWYQTRYPDEYIDIFFEGYNEVENINDYVFKNTKKPNMDWNEIYNTKVFLNLLNDNLKEYLNRPRYISYIGAGKYNMQERIELSRNGIIKYAYILNNYEGKNIKELYNDIISGKLKNDFIKENCSSRGKNSFLEELKEELVYAIKDYEDQVIAKDITLDCVMYSLMDYWNLSYGSKRALLFAEEFNRNIDIPIIYGATANNKNRAFINYYLMLGGNSNLECFEDYSRKKYSKIILNDFIKNVSISNYEKEMYERILGILNSSLPKDIDKFKARQKRIERKINRK